MSKMSFFAATAAVAALTAAPALARDNTATPESAKQQMKPQHSKSWKSSSRMSRTHDRMASQQDWNDRDARNSNRGWNNASWDNGDRRSDNRNWTHEGHWNESRADFWPGDVVGGAIGTAGAVTAATIGTAGAVATAPFGGPYRDSYAYDRGYDVSYNYNGTAIPYSGSYAARNGFVCQPGSTTRSPNGQLTICQ